MDEQGGPLTKDVFFYRLQACFVCCVYVLMIFDHNGIVVELCNELMTFIIMLK